MMRAIARRIKRRAWPLYERLQGTRWFRRLMTHNFSSGKLALGEKNRYGIRPEWITVDVDGADANVDFQRHGRLPFPDRSHAVIYSAHTIEHIDEATVAWMLKEAHRVLKPGGCIRLEAPDVESMVQAYRRRDRAMLDPLCQENRTTLVLGRGLPAVYAEDHVALLGLVSSYIERDVQIPVLAPKDEVDGKLASLTLEEFGQWCVSLQSPHQQRSGGHVTPIYFEKLSRLLRDAGFRDVARMENGRTRVPGLRLKNLERPHRAFCSLYAEAWK